MSHYTVLVINTQGIDDVDEQLEPFDESIEMDPYEKGEVSKEDLKSFKEFYTSTGQSAPYGLGYTPADKVLNKKLTIEQLYEKYGDDWNSRRWKVLRVKHNGVVTDKWIEVSTYNPNSKWDWYSVGGRWTGMFKLKEGADGAVGEPGAFGNKPRIEDGVDQACKGDIDWDGMIDPKRFDEAMRFWELTVEGQQPVNDEEKEMIKFEIYKPKYYIERYKDKTTYAKCRTQFSTYAVLKDGEWIAPGEMGYFGLSGAEANDELEFQLSYMKNIIEPLPDEALLTVVDCHI